MKRKAERPSSGRVRLAVFAASPIYYQTPLYKRIAADPHVDFTAIFASSGGLRSHDPGYGKEIIWDVSLIGGFRSIFLRRADRNSIGVSFFALRDFDIVREIIKGQYDVLWVHGYNSLTHVLAIVAQRMRGGQLLFREEQTLLEPRPLWKDAIKKLILPRLFSRGVGLFIGTQNKLWWQEYGFDERRLFAAPYCVDNERMQKAAANLKPNTDEIKRAFGIGEDSGPVILTVSRLVPNKQPLFLLEAFKQVRAKHKCTLLIVGSGELEAAMKNKVCTEKIPDVVFTGFLNQSEVPQAYICADIFTLVSSKHETWGLVVNEAMNFALPVVVSNKVGCGVDLVQPGKNGFLISAECVSDLVSALTMLMINPQLCQTFGADSFNRISAWNYDVTASGILRAVATSVGEKRWNRIVEES